MKKIEKEHGGLSENRDALGFMPEIESEGSVSIKLVEWTDQMNIGIKSIDEEHKRLFSVINDLVEAVNERRWADVHDELFEELVDCFTVYFAFEEGLMLLSNYPDFIFHREMHNYFTRKVKELRKKDISDNKEVARDALLFLADWFVNHDMNADKKMGEFILRDLREQRRVRDIEELRI